MPVDFFSVGKERSCGLALMIGRRICASVVAAGRRPTLGEVVTASSRHSTRGHDVSILMTLTGPVGRRRGDEPRSKISIAIMRPPQHGQGCEGGSATDSRVTRCLECADVQDRENENPGRR
jgi:hypothetical protein